MQNSKKDTDVYSRLLDSEGEGEGGMIWENGIETCILSCKKRIATPYHLSGSSPCTSPKHAVSCIGHRLVIRFLHDSIHVSVSFSQIIPPSPSPSDSKSLLYTSVSFLLSCIQGRHCHLSKFHIYVLVYCIGVFLSGLLHSL